MFVQGVSNLFGTAVLCLVSNKPLFQYGFEELALRCVRAFPQCHKLCRVGCPFPRFREWQFRISAYGMAYHPAIDAAHGKPRLGAGDRHAETETTKRGIVNVIALFSRLRLADGDVGEGFADKSRHSNRGLQMGYKTYGLG